MEAVKEVKIKNSVGRISFVMLSLLIQVGWLVLLAMKLSEVWGIIASVLQILALFLVFHIYSKETNAAFKMPWMILLVLLPFAGAILYLLMGRGKSTKRMAKHFESIDASIFPLLKQDEKVMELLARQDKSLYSKSRYIYDFGHYPVYENTDLVFYKDTVKALEAQVEAIGKAETFVFMEYHAIEDSVSFGKLKTALVAAVERGVEVRVFYDDMGSVGFLNKSFVHQMESLGIECRVFNPLVPVLNVFMNNRDHRKITVVDGKVGFTGGYNLADEYFNVVQPYGRWKDSGLRLEGDAVRSLTLLFLEMWNVSRDTDRDIEQYVKPYDYVAKEKGFVQPYGDSPLDYESVGENVYLSLIGSATESLYIATPYLIISDEMTRALSLAAKSGVDVRIITPGIPDKKPVYRLTRSYYPSLVKSGVRIYEYTPGFLHQKQFLQDNKVAVVGTINMDYRSLYFHFENAVLFHGYEAVGEVAEDFHEIMAESREVSALYMGKKKPLPAILRFFAPLM